MLIYGKNLYREQNMLDKQAGNNLLYLLSKKKTMLYVRFKSYINKMYSNRDKYFAYHLTRNLSALGYLELGNNRKGQTIVSISPPRLIELPFIVPQLMLTGARSPELLAVAKNVATIKQHEYLPDSIFVSSGDREDLLERRLHGDAVASFLKIPARPWAWDMLEFSGNLIDYRNYLTWYEGSHEHINEIFNQQDLKFERYNSNIEGEVLVKVSHYEKYSRNYLFNTDEHKKAKVNLDWGRFLVMQNATSPVLRYDRSRLVIRSSLPLPRLLERGLALCAGVPPKRYSIDGRQEFSFAKIAPKVAKIVAGKLQQQLYEARLDD